MAEQTIHRLTVADVIAETADACSLVFEVPAGLAEQLRYRPGQFLTLRVPSAQTGSVARCYSLSSAPHTGQLKVTVKRAGYASDWLNDNAAAGMQLDLLPPAGVFTPASLDTDMLCFAGGSGITPIMSIIKSVLAKGAGRIALIYANRDERSVIFAGELRDLVAAQPDRLVLVHWLETVQGLPSVAALRALAAPFAEAFTEPEAFICGPTPFMDATTRALADLSLPRERIRVERFQSLVRNPFERAGARNAAEEPNSGGSTTDEPIATVEVELDGQRHRLGWPAGKLLLDLLLDNGLAAPYSCREGRCSACACRKTSGEVKMINNQVLDDQDLADGYLLACQSLPVTDHIDITYD